MQDRGWSHLPATYDAVADELVDLLGDAGFADARAPYPDGHQTPRLYVRASAG